MNRFRHSRGFTAAEMLVTSAIAAVVVGAAAMGFHTMAHAQRQYAASLNISIGTTAKSRFYGTTGSTLVTFVAPNMGSAARAEALREKFLSDCTQSIAVYCLYRGSTTYNNVHVASIAAPPAGTLMDTPEAFRTYINTAVTGASSVFTTTYRNTGTTQNYTIFILGYSGVATTIPVLATYDIDFVTAKDANNTSTTLGTYASVKRYTGTTLSGYYDVVYLTGDATDQFYPGVVAFERRSRLAIAEGSTTIDRFKVAAEKPFYFIFWPDPLRDNMKLPTPNTTSSLNASFATTDPRKTYNHMAGRTSFMFTIAMFPSS